MDTFLVILGMWYNLVMLYKISCFNYTSWSNMESPRSVYKDYVITYYNSYLYEYEAGPKCRVIFICLLCNIIAMYIS